MKKKNTIVLWAMAALALMGKAFSDDHHHHQLSKDIDAFHAVLAPIWHAQLGPERLPAVCGKVDELALLASNIRSTDASKLVASIATMKNACQNKQGEADGVFGDVHEAFHHLIDAKASSAPL